MGGSRPLPPPPQRSAGTWGQQLRWGFLCRGGLGAVAHPLCSWPPHLLQHRALDPVPLLPGTIAPLSPVQPAPVSPYPARSREVLSPRSSLTDTGTPPRDPKDVPQSLCRQRAPSPFSLQPASSCPKSHTGGGAALPPIFFTLCTHKKTPPRLGDPPSLSQPRHIRPSLLGRAVEAAQPQPPPALSRPGAAAPAAPSPAPPQSRSPPEPPGTPRPGTHLPCLVMIISVWCLWNLAHSGKLLSITCTLPAARYPGRAQSGPARGHSAGAPPGP